MRHIRLLSQLQLAQTLVYMCCHTAAYAGLMALACARVHVEWPLRHV
jgi:hypothetical protein